MYRPHFLIAKSFHLDITTPWWVTVRSNSWSCTRHVCRVHFFNSSKGVTSGDIPDHLWDSNWPYLSNSTLSAWWCRCSTATESKPFMSSLGTSGCRRLLPQLGRHAVRGRDMESQYAINGYQWLLVGKNEGLWQALKMGSGKTHINGY